jgi:hypothetical protein
MSSILKSLYLAGAVVALGTLALGSAGVRAHEPAVETDTKASDEGQRQTAGADRLAFFLQPCL